MPVSTMKVTVSALLLLLCGLAVLADHTEVAATKSPIETNQADIHAVLREMSGLLAETRAELRCAKSKLEGMETRLAASEDKAEGLEKTVEEQRAVIQKLQEKQKEQEGVVEAVEARVSTKLKKTVEELEAVEGKMNTTGIQVEELRRAQAAERVSFSASLNISGNIGPLHPTPILVYKHVITNIGNHYNKNTGIFTAPVRGVYHFLVFAYGVGGSHATGVFLHKNGDPIVIAYSHQTGGSISPSNGASLLLEVGDVVS
ncbi:uncharacterized protein LOC134457412 [Engraulis encrasicolus]|uniref:uncharacterized protein LOC134457412 n=1 Tax=Engraulis encrasicolus TaxID=184585 RepID=UPI002FD089BD